MDIRHFDPQQFSERLRGLQGAQVHTQQDTSLAPSEVVDPAGEEVIVIDPTTLQTMLEQAAKNAVASALQNNTATPASFDVPKFLAGVEAGMRTASQNVVVANSARRPFFGEAVKVVCFAALGAGIFAGIKYLPDSITEATAEQSVETAAGNRTATPVMLRNTGNGMSLAEQSEEGVAPMTEKLENGSFVLGKTNIAWQRLTVSPDKTRYSIQLSIPSPAGGYLPDASLLERMSKDIQDEEIARFLLANGIVQPTNSSVYVEIVGRASTDGTQDVLKVLELRP